MQRYIQYHKPSSRKRFLTQREVDKAHDVPIAEYMEAAGCDMAKKGKMYYSPFRDERTPSFEVNENKNLWHDFGEGTGGDVIALAMRLEHLSFGDAVRRLLHGDVGDVSNTSGIIREHTKKAETHPRRDFVVKDIDNASLVAYASERGISEVILRRYCQQAEYTYTFDYHGEEMIGRASMIAFRTDSGGYELRDRRFKTGEGHKDIRVIAEDDAKNATYVIFEGFFNMLSYAEIMSSKGRTMPNVIVLNSVSIWQRAVDYLRRHGITGRIMLCLDNDAAGEETTQRLRKALPNAIDVRRQTLGEYNDLNDRLTGKLPSLADAQKSVTDASSSAAGTVAHDGIEHASTVTETASAAKVSVSHPSAALSDTSASLVSDLVGTPGNTVIDASQSSAGTVVHDSIEHAAEGKGTASAAKDVMPIPSEFKTAETASERLRQVTAENMPDRRDIYMHVASLGKYTITAYHDRIEAWLAGRGWMSFRTVIPFNYPRQLANKIVVLSAKDISNEELTDKINEYIYTNSIIWVKNRLMSSKMKASSQRT